MMGKITKGSAVQVGRLGIRGVPASANLHARVIAALDDGWLLQFDRIIENYAGERRIQWSARADEFTVLGPGGVPADRVRHVAIMFTHDDDGVRCSRPIMWDDAAEVAALAKAVRAMQRRQLAIGDRVASIYGGSPIGVVAAEFQREGRRILVIEKPHREYEVEDETVWERAPA